MIAIICYHPLIMNEKQVNSYNKLDILADFSLCKKLAFTLAEVLIVLGIIGIVAEMTIPTLMQNVQDQTWKAEWKKTYSTISQATLQIKTDNSGDLVGLFTDASTVLTLYSGKLRVLKNDGATLTLADGSTIRPSMVDTNCNTSWGTSAFGQYLCTEFYIDVNGDKKPNTAGKDQYWLGIGPDVVLPGGSPGIINATYSCPNGAYCNGYKDLYQ